MNDKIVDKCFKLKKQYPTSHFTGYYIEYVCCYVIYSYLQEQILANETGKCAQ